MIRITDWEQDDTMWQLACKMQGSKCDGMRRYAIPALLTPTSKHTGTSPDEKSIPVCQEAYWYDDNDRNVGYIGLQYREFIQYHSIQQ